ncbi:TetR family transcriptional regulator [Streptomyces sp. ISL-96]|uniref:TetR/AcrR family transcriptional regulator n=1 Tax=Streptomyces sp. ISL-96 TaxID=2819191 RepID=UPI001BE949DB|nr:TetR family transcriptional regulator [Streptomyces sp. ISL-96]MBT2493052.1 TetR family transcriptional regulator [Streptomyces sp. ISL-96]
MSETPAAEAPPVRRSDATKAAILDAARERFAADGYERATIRAIARDAGIDPSMVMRYYGNKEGLFAAASEFDLRMPDVGQLTELGALPGRHVGAVLVGHFLDRWEADEVLTALLRVGVTNAAGAERIQAIFREQLGPVAAGVCPEPREAPMRAALVASQILGMAVARYVLRLPPAVEMTRQEVIDWLAPTVQRYLTAERP